MRCQPFLPVYFPDLRAFALIVTQVCEGIVEKAGRCGEKSRKNRRVEPPRGQPVCTSW
jgi:hypothetical protein